MQISRRDFLTAGIAAGTALALPAKSLFAQPTILLQKKIPSTGESIPIIGIGTARRYEEIQTAAEKAGRRQSPAHPPPTRQAQDRSSRRPDDRARS